MRKNWRERESKTLTREKSHSNEIGSIWKVCFFGIQMHIHWPHLITDHQSETEGAWEGGRQQSHMKGDWDYIFHFSTAFLNHQNHLHLKARPAFSGLLSGFYQRHFVLIEKGLNRILNAICADFFLFRKEMMLRSQQRSISYSFTAEFSIFFSDLTRKVRSVEELLSACLHMLMHECKNPDSVVNAQDIHSRKNSAES